MALAYGADAVYLAGGHLRDAGLRGELLPGGPAPGRRPVPGEGGGPPRHLQYHAPQPGGGRPPALLELLEESGVTAVILADVGVLALAKRYAPSVKIHVSTQASVSNYQAARALRRSGGRTG